MRPSSVDSPATVRRLAFLAQAAEALSSSLDYDDTLTHLAQLAVPALGDACIIDIVEDGQLRRVGTAHVLPAKSALLDELRRRYPTTPDSPQPAARVMRSGEPELLRSVTPEVVATHTRDAEHAALILAIGMRSHLAVPLIARGAIVGVIGFVITESDRQYDEEDLAFARDLARQAALAVDNARLFRAVQLELAERRAAEESSRLSEARFRAVMEQSPLSTQVFTPDGRAVRANRAWEQLWGVTLDDIPEYNILADPQLEALGIAPLIRRAFAGEAVAIPPVRYDPNETIPDRTSHADPVRWVRAFAYPIKDDGGHVREVVLVHEDVTASRRADEKLRQSEERLRRALSVGRMNVWDWDLVTDRVECSQNAREFWGIDVGQVADFRSLIHPDDLPELDRRGQAALTGDGSYQAEYRLMQPDGTSRWVQSRGHVERGPDGTPRRILGVTVDISELKAAQETTRLLADAGQTLGASLDYHATLENLARLVVPRVADWCAVDLLTDSGALERVTVHHPDPARIALANEMFTRFPPRRSARFGAWRVIDTCEAQWVGDITDDVLHAVAQGTEHLNLMRGLGLRSFICVPLVARGACIGALTMAYAESDRRYQPADVEMAKDLAGRAAAAVDNARLYQQLRAEDRRKDEFLATLAHELRNPLAPIRTGLALLRVAGDSDSAERTRQVMERQLGHMVRLIDDLLDLSRVTRGRVPLDRERVDLWSLVGAALETSRPLIDAAGLQLEVRLPQAPVVLHADRTRLAQVFGNLLNNAAKYTEPGGRVELDATVEDGHVTIRVKDTGVGIPREMLTQIFEMFSQVSDSTHRSQGGLGIGLTLVKRLVELHDGRVWAESDGPNKGSTFFVRLPVASMRSAAPMVPAKRAERQVSPSARRVLVVDDNEDAADTLSTLLTHAGHMVRTAASGLAALDLLQEFRPDVAFLDIGMPGMSGYELARRLRAEPSLGGLLLVALTGWGQREDRRQSREAGFDLHVVKPVDPHEVQHIVEHAMHR